MIHSQVQGRTEAALSSMTDLKEAIQSIKVNTELKNRNKYNMQYNRAKHITLIIKTRSCLGNDLLLKWFSAPFVIVLCKDHAESK